MKILVFISIFCFSIISWSESNVAAEKEALNTGIAKSIEKKLFSISDSIFDATTSANEYGGQLFDLTKVQTYIVDPAHSFSYEKVNDQLSLLSHQLAKHSQYVKSANLYIDSNIGSKTHKFMVDYTPYIASAMHFYISVDMQGELEEKLQKTNLKISNLDLGFKLSRGFGLRGAWNLAYVDSLELKFKVGVNTLEVIKKFFKPQLVDEYCLSAEVEELKKQEPEIEKVIDLSCGVAKDMAVAADFKSLLKDTQSSLEELDALINDTIKKILKRDLGD
ncbi:MAG: hypothetical protein KDD40_12380, partial [Bdellovibrionales bacterium]|nr:hypothetical protein [Bdellovibrionales bacterium]